MSLRVSNPEPSTPGNVEDASNAPLSNPFAAGTGGFVTEADLQSRSSPLQGLGILLAVLVAAAGILLGMRQMGMGPKLALANIEIDYPLEVQSPALSNSHEKILKDLNSGGDVQRVPLEMVQTNPFAWRDLIPDETPQITEVDPAELTRREEEERRKNIEARAEALVLNSVLGGRVPVARIGGQMVRVGDTIDEIFTVQAISGRSVEIASGEQTFTLTIDAQDEAKAPTRKSASSKR